MVVDERLTLTPWIAIGAVLIASVRTVAGEPPHSAAERSECGFVRLQPIPCNRLVQRRSADTGSSRAARRAGR